MSALLIFGLAVVSATYLIIMKILTLKEWDMKYNPKPVKERRSEKWSDL